MAQIQFIRVGNLWLNISEVRAIQQDRDGGEVVLHYGARCNPVSSDDGKALIEWAEANIVIPTQKAEARAEVKAKADAKAKHEADAKAKADAKADAKTESDAKHKDEKK